VAILHAMGYLGDTEPDAEITKLKDLCTSLGLKNTFLDGVRGQDQFAEIYTVSNLGCLTSCRELFGSFFC